MKLLSALFTLLAACVTVHATPIVLEWQASNDAPIAVARAFSGVLDNKLIMAGGSAFIDGAKQYTSAIYQLNPDTSTWARIGTLPKPIAEGGAAVINVGTLTSAKNVLVCFGGITSDGPTNEAFTIDAVGNVEPLPPCPYGTLSMTAVATYNNTAVFLCGKLNKELTNRVLTLTYKDAKWVWGEMPAIPGAPREQAVAAVQNGDQKAKELVVFGGTIRNADGKPCATYDGFGYQKQFDGSYAWKPLEKVPVSTIGASLTPIGDQHLLLSGGYNGTLWDRANRMLPEDWKKMLAEPAEKFGWNNKIYTYHTVTGRWVEYAALPKEMHPRCGASVAILQIKEKVGTRPELFIAGGEIKPATRTASMFKASFKRNGWRFSAVSWIVIVIFFMGMAGMAVWFALKEKTADTYFRGGKSIPWFVAGMSIYATMLSSITFISVPTMAYISDWRYFTMALTILALAPIAIYFYLPFFCRLNITSAYEYLEKRFNLGIRLFGAAVFNIFMICRVSVVTLLPAIALNAVTAIPIEVCILLCGIATIIYCYVGGVDAVIWSDFVQGIILLGGALVVLGSLIVGSGGIGSFWTTAVAADKMRIWDFRFLLSEPVFWVVLVMGLVSNLSSYTSDQCVVQRYITTPDEKAAGRSIWFNGVLSVVSSVIFYMIGTALYTHYKTNPQLMDVTMAKSDSIFPLFMAIELHPVIAGLIIAGIFAATISTLSTNLNSAATSITTDFIARFRPGMSSKAQVTSGRICVIIVGIAGVVAALILARIPSRSLFDNFQNFIGTLTGGLSALFFIGIFMPRVSGMAATIALLVNYILSLGLKYMLPGLHPFLYGGIALVACIILAYILSFVLPNRKNVTGLTHFSKPERR